MPLPPPSAPRRRMHLRQVVLEGFKRDDGLWDIEARLTDTKDHDYALSSGVRRQGEAVHDLWLRLTIDARFFVVDAAASSDATPYMGDCDRITPAYRALVGLNLFQGFRQAVKERLGGTLGCSHLTELALQIPTAALQTYASEITDNEDTGQKPFQLDRCHALETTSPVVRRYYPRWYRGGLPSEAGASASLSAVALQQPAPVSAAATGARSACKGEAGNDPARCCQSVG
ncbi:DUF2889 domain-containing protein [Oryzomicrobium sp.]|uniref:DUF2889 domain-containing protein n=1 Tax=Oryzomicrobium sp. TaxID=1911578 RepID=UPI002FE23B70